jgi:hypothetical protein
VDFLFADATAAKPPQLRCNGFFSSPEGCDANRSERRWQNRCCAIGTLSGQSDRAATALMSRTHFAI